MNRRNFTRGAALAALSAIGKSVMATPKIRTGKSPVILLRGSWQCINIGDIGHTPGALDLIRRYCPEAQVILWPSPGALQLGVREFLLKSFPRLRIAQGTVRNGAPTTPELLAAWKVADFMLHGSGSGFGARAQLAAWHRATGKPYGAFGVSADPISGVGPGLLSEGGTLNELSVKIAQLPPDHMDLETRRIIETSSFMFCRDSISLEYLKLQGVHPPILEFGPDTQFAMTQSNQARASSYLNAHSLQKNKFICVVPRLRYTPYWKIHHARLTNDDEVKEKVNLQTAEMDHAKLREMMIAYVRRTGNKVLACPEMTYEVDLAKCLLVDPLPADVKEKVVWRDSFWLPDEAAGVYSQAQALVSIECHSPIISLAHGTPAFYVRQPTDTSKGQMYRDIGLGDWLFEIDEIDGQSLWANLERVLNHPTETTDQIRRAMDRVRRLQRRMAEALASAIEL